jgi:3D (Asp-Asp-Asp) domain-containing protein
LPRRVVGLAIVAAILPALNSQSSRYPTPFIATAYTGEGLTSSGLRVRPGMVAADPNVLPPGTKIKVTNAGPHSGVYTVTDTGAKVRGRHIDIFLPSWTRAKEFGRKLVHVTVLRWGHWNQRE